MKKLSYYTPKQWKLKVTSFAPCKCVGENNPLWDICVCPIAGVWVKDNFWDELSDILLPKGDKNGKH